jgi:hypothetical protein
MVSSSWSSVRAVRTPNSTTDDGGRRTGSGADADGSGNAVGMVLWASGTGSTGVGTGAGDRVKSQPTTRRATAIPT